MTQVTFAGPTTLQPLIEKSIEYSKQNPGQHILSFILCDGGMCKPITDAEWVKKACDYPISFVIISLSQEHDVSLKRIDNMKGRKFDNVNCVNYPNLQKTMSKKIKQELKSMGKHVSEALSGQVMQMYAIDKAIANEVFMEIPDQFVQMVKLGLLPENDKVKRTGVVSEVLLDGDETVNMEEIQKVKNGYTNLCTADQKPE